MKSVEHTQQTVGTQMADLEKSKTELEIEIINELKVSNKYLKRISFAVMTLFLFFILMIAFVFFVDTYY